MPRVLRSVMTHVLDTIVIGGSAGGFIALRELLTLLPGDMPATVLAVLHGSGDERSIAHRLLQPYCAMPIRLAEDGMPIRRGEVVLAPADRHMLMGAGHVHLRRGPRENNFRPAIDPLFRSAAVQRGSRAAGVVLSGLLDDGAAGLRAMAQTGAKALVQSPDDADYEEMPKSALRAVPNAERHDLPGLAERLVHYAGSPVAPPVAPPDEVRIELMIASLEKQDMETVEKLGTLSPFNCPDCNGVLWEIEDGDLRRYRCHTGHAYGEASLSEAQEAALERSLYDTLRAHKGRAELLRRMAKTASARSEAARLMDRARGCEEDAALVEDVLRRQRRVPA